MLLKAYVLIHFVLIALLCSGQNEQAPEHKVYCQKVLAESNETQLIATHIFDSLQIYGFIAGYDPNAIQQLNWTGKFQGLKDQVREAVFHNVSPDTVRVLIDSYKPTLSEQVVYNGSAIYGFVLMGEKVVGPPWVYDIYYSELLNFADIEFTERHLALVVSPWERKDLLHYRIFEIVKNENGKVEISFTSVDYTNPLAPLILESSRTEITKAKNLEVLNEKLEQVKNLDTKNHCTDPGFPMLIMVTDKVFYYTYQCLRENKKTVSEAPIALSTYMERLYSKYLFAK